MTSGCLNARRLFACFRAALLLLGKAWWATASATQSAIWRARAMSAAEYASARVEQKIKPPSTPPRRRTETRMYERKPLLNSSRNNGWTSYSTTFELSSPAIHSEPVSVRPPGCILTSLRTKAPCSMARRTGKGVVMSPDSPACHRIARSRARVDDPRRAGRARESRAGRSGMPRTRFARGFHACRDSRRACVAAGPESRWSRPGCSYPPLAHANPACGSIDSELGSWERFLFSGQGRRAVKV
jgi:hypothetical protein